MVTQALSNCIVRLSRYQTDCVGKQDYSNILEKVTAIEKHETKEKSRSVGSMSHRAFGFLAFNIEVSLTRLDAPKSSQTSLTSSGRKTLRGLLLLTLANQCPIFKIVVIPNNHHSTTPPKTHPNSLPRPHSPLQDAVGVVIFPL